MLRILIAALLVLPFVEAWAAIQVAQQIGFFATGMLLVVMSFVGVGLLRREGTTIWRKASAEMSAGRVPAADLVDAGVRVLGAVLLIIPGFVSGAFGLVLLVSPARRVLRSALAGSFARRAARAATSGGLYITTNVNGFGGAQGFGPSDQFRGGNDVIDAEGWDVTNSRELDTPSEAADKRASTEGTDS